MARARRERRVQFVFGECVLDTDRRELSRKSESVAVGPQVFDLLIHLIENRGRVVSKDELFDVIWRGRTVSEVNLDQSCQFRAKGDRRHRRGPAPDPDNPAQRVSIRWRRA